MGDLYYIPCRPDHRGSYSTEVLGNLAKIGRQASDYYACALLEFLKLCSDLFRTLEK